MKKIIISTLILSASILAQDPIIHDGEFNFVQAQYKQAWDTQDKDIDAKFINKHGTHKIKILTPSWKKSPNRMAERERIYSTF